MTRYLVELEALGQRAISGRYTPYERREFYVDARDRNHAYRLALARKHVRDVISEERPVRVMVSVAYTGEE